MTTVHHTPIFGMLLLIICTSLPIGVSKTGPMMSATATVDVFATSYVTQTGGSGGEPVGNLAMMDEFVNDDNPWTYVTFKTPGAALYQGYRRYFLPSDIQRAAVTGLRVRANYKGRAKASQAWTWYLYDWTARKWVRIGDNAGATANRWKLFTFNPTSPVRFINSSSHEIRVQIRSNNASGDAKLDYEALTVTYNPPPALTASPTVTSTRTATLPPPTPTRTTTPGPSPTPTATTPPGDGDWPPAVPASLALTVRETSGVARVNEVIRSGVPLARSHNILNTSQLTIVDASDTPVPAEFQVLARWDAGRTNASAPVQWLLVTFPATVAANQSATYRLVTDGSAGPNPAPAVPLSLIQNGNQVTVDTGAATFTFGGDATMLFDTVRQANDTQLINGSNLSVNINNGAAQGHSTTRSVTIEHYGPLTVIVVVRGAYNAAAVGGGVLSSMRRYVFTAGSPTVIVRQALNWEGDRCGDGSNGYDLTCNGNVNGLRITRLRDVLNLTLAAPFNVTAVGDFDTGAVTGSISGQEASIRQILRNARTNPLAFSVAVPGTAGASGIKADGGLLAVSGAPGAVAIALNHMHRYEPQALRLLANGQLALDLVDDDIWLGQRQGAFATFAVGALPSGPSRADLNRLVWAPLNHPLRAWPSAAWFASSNALDEFPSAGLPAAVSGYGTLVPEVLDQTLQGIDQRGLAGLMTFGLYPRFWGYPLYSDELDCGDDPTPAESWDNTYWCATWTDYHNTVAAAPTWAMRTGEVEWLDELAFPGALRMLHTQIMQCAPGDTYFYCGQSPAGYGGYRSDFNSSHAYFDNLFLYYWLTGDYTVVEMLERGGSSMRDYLCSRRPAQPCLPTDVPSDEWAQLTGRVAMQWFAAFRFIGLAGNDPGYLDDYKSGLARAITQYYVEPVQNGTSYGFWLDCPVSRAAPCPIGRPAASTDNYTGQLWMVSLYDMNLLYRLQRDTNDAPLGSPALAPSHVLASWARTLLQFGSTVGNGNGTAGGNWPNVVRVIHSGTRVGGSLVSVTTNVDPDGNGTPCDAAQDECLYTTGKATLSAVLMRAADQTGSAAMRQMGRDFTTQAIANAQSDISPFGKIIGEYLARLHAAVARFEP